jgi:sec-independent protein translocase protein TatA
MFGKIEELAIIVLILLLLFGHKRIPELARSLGRSVKEVRKGFNDDSVDKPEKKDK